MRLSTKMALVFGAFFISGSTAAGIGAYRNEQDRSRISDEKDRIVTNGGLSGEEKTLLIRTVPGEDDTNIAALSLGLIMAAGSFGIAGVTIAQRHAESRQ